MNFISMNSSICLNLHGNKTSLEEKKFFVFRRCSHVAVAILVTFLLCDSVSLRLCLPLLASTYAKNNV